MAADREAAERLRLAIEETCGEGVVTSWILVAEVAHGDGSQRLALRAGTMGGDWPAAWAGLGMLQAGVLMAEGEVLANTSSSDDEDESPGG